MLKEKIGSSKQVLNNIILHLNNVYDLQDTRGEKLTSK